MKNRIRKIATFFLFNLFFFGLYLNFIHKDKPATQSAATASQHTTAAFSASMLTANVSK
jgi:hypothetical protein